MDYGSRMMAISLIDHIDESTIDDALSALNSPTTPAYVYSERGLLTAAAQSSDVAAFVGCALLYTLKACALAPVLETLAPSVDGFAASSVFEARLARQSLRLDQSLHCYSPAFSPQDMADAMALSDFVSLNSLYQLRMAEDLRPDGVSLGLRVNPELRFAADARYDPSRPNSKLGAPLSMLADLLPRYADGSAIAGIHMHNNCESSDMSELTMTAEKAMAAASLLHDVEWINLGGGYYFDTDSDAEPLRSVIERITERFGATVFLEPGTGLVQQAGFLVTEILDVFETQGADVAVLDASTSHMPEVFEYDFTPAVVGPELGAGRKTILAGRSCLAGDMFGEYDFGERVERGQRVVILDAGSYAHSRAASFNGIPIPDAYMLKADGSFLPSSSFQYADFSRRNGAF